QLHDPKISEQRNCSVAQVEGGESSQPRVCKPVGPGETLVPEEVVNGRKFDCECSREQITPSEGGAKRCQNCELHADPNRSQGVELHPADKTHTWAGHAIRSLS